MKASLPLLLLVVWLAAAAFASDIRIAGLFPLTYVNSNGTDEKSIPGYELRTAFNLAVDWVNNQTDLLPHDRLTTTIIDTKMDSIEALHRTENILIGPDSTPQVAGIIGPSFSSVALGTSWLSSALQIPMISYAATSVAFSDHVAYPYFYRVIPADEWQGKALADICAQLRVARAAILYVDDAYGRSGVEEFKDSIGDAIEITYESSHPPHLGDEVSAAAIREGLHHDFDMIRAGVGGFPTNVILLFTLSEIAHTVFQIAEEDDMLTDYAYFGSEALMTTDVWGDDEVMRRAMQGILGVAPEFGEGELYDTAVNLYRDNRVIGDYSSPYFGLNDSFSRWMPFVFDAVLALAHGLNATIAAGDDPLVGETLTQQIAAVNFSGTTVKHLNFEANGDVAGTYYIQNLQDSEFSHVGEWVAHQDGSIEMVLREDRIMYPSGSNEKPFIPRDWAAALIREPGNEVTSAWTSMVVDALRQVSNEDPTFQYGYQPDSAIAGKNQIEATLEQFEHYHDLGYQIYIAPNFYVVSLVAQQTAARFPESYFIAVDAEVHEPNVYSIVFSEDEASYVAGVLAGSVSLTGKIGVVAGPNAFPPIKRFSNGFKHGARRACPTCTVTQLWTPGFSTGYDPFVDPELGRSMASELLAAGCDVIFGVAGTTGSAAILHAAQHGAWVVGVDLDEYEFTFNSGAVNGSEKLITSVLKQINVPIDHALHLMINSSSPISAVVEVGLATGALALAPCHEACAVVNPHASLLNQTIQEIIAFPGTTGVIHDTGDEFVQPEDCPVGTQFVESSTDPSKNLCSPCSLDTFNIDGNGDRCQECPVGAVCRGESQIKALRGYWRSSNTSLGKPTGNGYTFFQCPLDYACEGALELFEQPGEPPEGCARGFIGNLCFACAPGFGHSGLSQGCQRCPEHGYNELIILGVIVLIILVAVLMIRSQLKASGDHPKDVSIVVKILMSWLQVISLFASFEIDWPREILALLTAEASVAAAGDSFINTDCALDKQRLSDVPLVYQKALLYATLPIVSVVVPILAWLLVWAVQRFILLDSPKWKYWERVIVSVVVLLFLFHPTVTQSTLSMFTCDELENNEWFLHADPNISCDDPAHKRWLWGLGVPSFFFYVIGIPLSGAMVLYRHRNELEKDEYRRYRFLFAGYRPKRYYWETVVTLRKVGIVVAEVSVASSGVTYQAMVALLVILIATIAEVYQRPFQSTQMNRLEEASLLTGSITLYIGLLFLLSDSLSRDSKIVLTALLFLFNLAFLLYTLKEFYSAAKDLAKEKLEAHQRRRTLVKERKSVMQLGNTVEMTSVTRSALKLDAGIGRVVRRESDITEMKAQVSSVVEDWAAPSTPRSGTIRRGGAPTSDGRGAVGGGGGSDSESDDGAGLQHVNPVFSSVRRTNV